jgi:hypothetical protein
MANTVGKALRTKILSYSGVSALIGTRMYPSALLQGATLPAVVYTKLSTPQNHTISDVTKLVHPTFQIDCYAATKDEADAVSNAIRYSGICSYQGTTAGIYFCGTEISSGEYDGDESPTDGNQEHRYITSFDLQVHTQEA